MWFRLEEDTLSVVERVEIESESGSTILNTESTYGDSTCSTNSNFVNVTADDFKTVNTSITLTAST